MSAPVKNNSGPPLNLDDLRAVPVGHDGDLMGDGGIDAPVLGVVEIVDDNRCTIVQSGLDAPTSLDVDVAPLTETFDENTLGDSVPHDGPPIVYKLITPWGEYEMKRGVPHEGPPIGYKLITPGGEYEMTPDGLLDRPMPFDPKRGYRIVKSV